MASGPWRLGLAFPVLGVCLVLIAGCSEKPDPELLNSAWEWGEAYRWPEAGALARAYLLDDPGNAPAHFLLGRSYLHLNPPWLILAEGELRMALRRFQESGDLGPLALRLTPSQFEAAIHRELARTEMRWIREAVVRNVPSHLLQPRIASALDEVGKGRALDPDCPVLADMESTLEAYRRPMGRDLSRGRGAEGTPSVNAGGRE
jgi:hypothetical protein